MNIGLIIICIGFALAYFTIQLVPLFDTISTLTKEDIKKITFNEWLVAPLLFIVLLTPIVGTLVNFPGTYERKWCKTLSIISAYLIIIGFILAIIFNEL